MISIEVSEAFHKLNSHLWWKRSVNYDCRDLPQLEKGESMKNLQLMSLLMVQY